jgi:predicted dienelactone hydrolase
MVKVPQMNFITKPIHFSRRQVLQAAVATGLGGALPFTVQAAELSAPQDEVWNDAARAREVPALLRWPAGKPLGVMVYSHGLGGKKEGGDYWGKAWASAGLLVVHLQHRGSDAASLKGGFSALREASKPEQLIARIQDVRFAIAEINRRRASGADRWAGLPTDKMAVGGHSFGARTTMLSAGWQHNGVSGSDPQPKAFVAMSPALGKDVSLAQGRKELASVTRPFLICTGSLDGEIMNNGETPESRRMVYDALPAGKKALLWLDGADHFTFAGNEKLIPSTFIVRRSKETLDTEAAHHERVARISTAWLKEQLFGQAMGAVAGLGASDQFLRA